jgi:hypothetical protein
LECEESDSSQSLQSVARQLATYRLDLMGVQRLDGTRRHRTSGGLTFFCVEKGMKTKLRTGNLACKRILSIVRGVEFNGDGMSQAWYCQSNCILILLCFNDSGFRCLVCENEISKRGYLIDLTKRSPDKGHLFALIRQGQIVPVYFHSF